MSMEFCRQKYWSMLPFPSPGDLPNPGFKPSSPTLASGRLTTELPSKSNYKLGVDLFLFIIEIIQYVLWAQVDQW